MPGECPGHSATKAQLLRKLNLPELEELSASVFSERTGLPDITKNLIPIDSEVPL
jgi:hypothetical protein